MNCIGQISLAGEKRHSVSKELQEFLEHCCSLTCLKIKILNSGSKYVVGLVCSQAANKDTGRRIFRSHTPEYLRFYNKEIKIMNKTDNTRLNVTLRRVRVSNVAV